MCQALADLELTGALQARLPASCAIAVSLPQQGLKLSSVPTLPGVSSLLVKTGQSSSSKIGPQSSHAL